MNESTNNRDELIRAASDVVTQAITRQWKDGEDVPDYLETVIKTACTYLIQEWKNDQGLRGIFEEEVIRNNMDRMTEQEVILKSVLGSPPPGNPRTG